MHSVRNLEDAPTAAPHSAGPRPVVGEAWAHWAAEHLIEAFGDAAPLVAGESRDRMRASGEHAAADGFSAVVRIAERLVSVRPRPRAAALN